MKKSLLVRGFKAKSERLAIEFRLNLGLKDSDPLCAYKLAESLNILVHPIKDFIKNEEDLMLFSNNKGSGSGWSGLTMRNKKNDQLIIYNHFHSQCRQQSDIMHEISHIICEHEVDISIYNFNIPFGMPIIIPKHEEEARCLGSTLQLPKSALLWATKKKMNAIEISEYYNASEEMVNYRLNITGISKIKFYQKTL